MRRGVVTHEELLAADVTRDEINVRLRRKRLIPLWRGVYLVGHADPPPLALEYAALKFAGPHAAICGRSAAVLYGLLPTQIDPTIHVALDAKRSSPDGLKLHTRNLHESEVRTIHGDIRITTPERTILDITPTLDDDQLENVIARAIRERLASERKLKAQLALRKGARGARRLRVVLDVGPEWTASQAERVLLKTTRDAELPRPQLNQRMGRRIPDFVFKQQRVIVEVDSWRWHGDRLSFESDTDRHARWVAAGWTVVRFTARQLRDQPLLVVARLAATLARRAV